MSSFYVVRQILREYKRSDRIWVYSENNRPTTDEMLESGITAGQEIPDEWFTVLKSQLADKIGSKDYERLDISAGDLRDIFAIWDDQLHDLLHDMIEDGELLGKGGER